MDINTEKSENIVPLQHPANPPVQEPAKEVFIEVGFTLDEANALSNLLDAAVKTNGLPAAVAAVPLFHKLRFAADAYKAKTA